MHSILMSEQYAHNSVTQKNEFADSAIPMMETALHHAQMSKLAARTDSGLGVSLSELPMAGLLVFRASKDKAALAKAVESVLQVSLPETLSTSIVGDKCVRWIAPDEWLLSCAIDEAYTIEKSIREITGDASIAIVNVAGGFSALTLQGPSAVDVLRKSTAYDVHPQNLMPGKVVNTVFAKAQVCLRCVEENHYELIIRRSFADYVWHWLQVASAEYGLSIEVG